MVRTRRHALGLSQEDLADRAGVDVKTVRDLERGLRRPRPSTVRALADALALTDGDRHSFCASAPEREADGWPTVPAQLPMDVRGFVGRADVMAALDTALGAAVGGSAGRVAVLTGMPGVGKTAAALHWAHAVREAFPDGQLFVDLHGTHMPWERPGTADILRILLTGLGISPALLADDPVVMSALYRSTLAQRRMLIVLDDAYDSAQVRPLLPGTPACRTLLTSRVHLTSLIAREAAVPIAVGPLTADESCALLAARLDTGRVRAPTDTTETVIAMCGGLPLALALATAMTGGGAMVDQGSWSERVNAAFDSSYRSLAPATARLFRLLGRARVEQVTPEEAALIDGGPAPAVWQQLADLVAANLLVGRDHGLYAMHPLLRAYAARLAEACDRPRTTSASRIGRPGVPGQLPVFALVPRSTA